MTEAEQIEQQIAALQEKLKQIHAKNVSEEIGTLMSEATAMIRKAEQLAEDAGISFYFGGPAYGMGGSYTSSQRERSSWYSDGEQTEAGGYWMPSSQSC